MRNRYLYITLLSILAWHAEAQGQAGTKQVPRLVVNVTVDQLRSDLLDLYAPAFSSREGLQKLLAEGLVFENARYPFADVDRASAISSVVTGTTPFYHTITGNQWIDRQSLRPVSPTPGDMAASTIGDELKRATQGQGKVFAVAPTKEVAMLAAGHTADGTVWNDTPKKGWTAADITDRALRCMTDHALGQDSIADLLLLTYDASGNDRQTYIQLDQEIARLLQQTEAQVGKDQALFLITSTGYTEEKRADLERFNIPAGTFYINRTANLLNMYFGGLWGQGKYVEAHFKNQLYINRQLIENKRITTNEVLQRAKEFLLQMSGVKAVENHLYEAHTGDLVIELNPGWQIENEDTHEQSPVKTQLAYFPIIIYGSGIMSETIKTPVSIERIAPSIAKAIRIRAPNACKSEPLF